MSKITDPTRENLPTSLGMMTLISSVAKSHSFAVTGIDQYKNLHCEPPVTLLASKSSPR
jgi:hypothetical protein